MATIRSDAGGDGTVVGSVRWWQQQWPFLAWTGLAPQQLTQPINPGWSFGNLVTVTNVNSSAPEVERDVLARHSYGRQLGKLVDAVTALAGQLPAAAGDVRIEEFMALAADIDGIKRRARPSSLEKLREALAELKRSDPKAYAELRDVL